MTTTVLAILAGFGFGLSLIVAIGTQNAYVLRQGLRGEHVLAVVGICVISDAVLIAGGVVGLGGLLDRLPWLLTALRLLGAAFLLGYAVVAARRAVRPSRLVAVTAGEPARLWSVAATCAAFTWLNPHVYLDTVVLLGSVAATHGPDRGWFGVGAVLGSLVWFSALGFGARVLRPLFVRPIAWRVLDGLVAVVMTVIAASLLLSTG